MSFDDFWSAYPLKKGKGYARKCYEKARKNGMPPDSTLIKAIGEQRREKLFFKSQNRFVPEWKNPSTWINQECWGDVCETSKIKSKPKPQRTTNEKLRLAFNALIQTRGKHIDKIKYRFGLTDYEVECALMAYNGGPQNVKKMASGMLQGVG